LCCSRMFKILGAEEKQRGYCQNNRVCDMVVKCLADMEN